ncbi:hypothetical protein [Thermocrinis sp.]
MMQDIALDGKVGGFLGIHQLVVFELSLVPSKILVETAFGKMNLFVLGEEYPNLGKEDAELLKYPKGIKYHLPRGTFHLNRYFLVGEIKAIALQGLDLLNLFWLEVS